MTLLPSPTRSPRNGAEQRRRQRFVRLWIIRFGNVCHYCGRPMRTAESGEGAGAPEVATVDHVVPSARGGERHRRNWQVVCYACNQAKGTLTHTEFLHLLDGTTPPRRPTVDQAALDREFAELAAAFARAYREEGNHKEAALFARWALDLHRQRLSP